MALRIAATVVVLGALAVWLVAPVGNACPDLGRLPSGSSASSSPSLKPPLTRTCTYTTPEGTEAHARYVPWLDWILLVLLAAVAATVARLVGSSGGRAPRAPKAPAEPRAEREPKASREPKPQREPRAPDRAGVRDDAERERARRERAERARRGR
jgi:hypothetical protein